MDPGHGGYLHLHLHLHLLCYEHERRVECQIPNMTGRSNPWAICRSADLVASSCRARGRAASSSALRKLAAHQTRWLRTSVPRATDGVFRGLTDGRLPTPWIEAFRKQQQADQGTAAREARSKARDLSPGKMSDSYPRVVLPLGQDPWLSDTYINSSGHIRYVSSGDAPSPAVSVSLARRLTNAATPQAGDHLHGPGCS